MKKQKAGLLAAAFIAATTGFGGTAAAAERDPVAMAPAEAADVQPVPHIVEPARVSGPDASPLADRYTPPAPVKRGGASTESVIGSDSRTQVTNTTSAPSSSIVQIEFNAGSICTGALISDDTVLTAGHCVHRGGTGSAADYSWGIRVAPGRNGSRDPYGRCGATELYTDQRWIDSANTNADWGVIKLDCAVGNTTGWLGYTGTTGSLAGSTATVRGYPGDKPRGTMWTMTGSVSSTQPEKVFYTMDTSGGQSGAPVYNSSASIVAIHTNGGSTNSGTRITPALARYLDTVR